MAMRIAAVGRQPEFWNIGVGIWAGNIWRIFSHDTCSSKSGLAGAARPRASDRAFQFMVHAEIVDHYPCQK
jgi:hypothetical protein